MRALFSAVMEKPSAGEQQSSHRKPHKLVLFIILALLFAFLLVATGAVIANSNTRKTIEPATIADVNQSLPAIQLTSTTSSEIVQFSDAVFDTPVAVASPTLLPSLTPIPTSTATEAPFLPTPSPGATVTPLLSLNSEDVVSNEKPSPLPTPAGVYSWTLKVPILMYHYISVPPEDADKYRVDLSVSPNTFREQMAYLAENNFQTVDLYDLSLAITGKRDLPEKPVILTFDDGYRDNYENAFPVLQEYGMTATFFIVTQPIDENNENYLTWDMVREMANAGMRIEPHSKTHADLSSREKEFVIYEVLGSQETIAAHTGQTPRFFCYPGGRFDEKTIEVISELDFWGAVTTVGGKWHGYNERYQWPRLRMRNTTVLAEFADMVNPGDTVSGKNVEG